MYMYDEDTYEQFIETFACLPVAATVNGMYLGMHGGISPRLTNLKAINDFERRVEPEEETLLFDLLWADPAPFVSCETYDFKENEDRGMSVVFGKNPLKAILA